MGNTSDTISIILYATEPTIRTPTSILYINLTEYLGIYNSATTEAEGMNNPATNTVYIISFSSVATALAISLVIFITVMVILIRSKAKNTAVFALSNRAEGTIHNEPEYENVVGPLPSVSTITNQDNVAYGCIQLQ